MPPNRLFLIAFSASIALAPLSALSAAEGSASGAEEIVLSTAEGTLLRVIGQPAAITEGAATLGNSLPAASADVPSSLTPIATTATAPAAAPNTTTTALLDASSSALPATAEAIAVPTEEFGPPRNDIWQRIRAGFAMKELKSPLIKVHEKWYARNPEYVGRMTDRAQRYLYYITEEVERRGMPTEIALLPMIESAFNPGAYSVARASGIWQFIPSTGKHFGMQQNWWYDGRRDVITATNGALDYLQKLHDQFGDWELALAAYNWGENAVERAQAKNRKRHKPTNFASLQRMPRETRNYVPKLLAVKNIVENPERYGLSLQYIANAPYFVPVATNKHIDVELAAQLADISMEEFTALNPGNTRPVILTDTSNVLLLPANKVDTFRTNLEAHDKPLVSWKEYQPQKGEKLDEIAERFGLTVEKLRSSNGLSPRLKESNGQALLVPRSADETENEFTAFNTNLGPSDGNLVNTRHRVRRGDTLSGIARHYHVSLARLKSWNPGVKLLRPGQFIAVVQNVDGDVRHRRKSHTKLVAHKTKKQQPARKRMQVAIR